VKNSRNRTRKCLIYLKNERDRRLLAPNARLYGLLAPPSGSIIMTPYPPPSGSFPVVGVIEEEAGAEHERPGLLAVSTNGRSLAARGLIDDQRVEMPVEIVYKAAGYARTPFSPGEMELLENQTVTVIGCGSGGSKMVLELTRAGVGHLKLADPAVMELHNVSRHEGDLFDVGKPKTQVVAERIYRINPATRIETYCEDIFERPLNEIKEIMRGDLVVAATDRTSKQLMINELTQRFGIACVFGGCYEEARGGEVFYTLPGEKMPCLACLRAGLKQPKRSAKIDYSTATGPEDYEGEPGLHASVDFVTCLEVQICLAILLRKVPASRLAKLIDPRFNFILIGGALASGFYRFKKPFHIFFQPLKGPRKSCPVCGDARLML